MAKAKSELNSASAAAAMRTIAHDGYLAYIEWPVFLAHRLKQVERHLGVTAAASPGTVVEESSRLPATKPSARQAPGVSAPSAPFAQPKAPAARRAAQAGALIGAEQPVPQTQAAPEQKPAAPVSPPTQPESLALQAQPVAEAVQASTPDSAESNLLRFLDNFDMQGEEM